MLALKEARHLFTLALPIIIAQLAQTSMGFVDTLMVGRLGREALASIALGSSVFFFILVVSIGVLLSVNPTVSQAYGAGDHSAVGRAVRQGLWLASGLALLATLLAQNISPLLLMTGQDEATVTLANAYLKAISWGILPSLWLAVLRGLLEGLAEPRPLTIITVIGVGLNVLGNYTLMFGNFGFPALGLVGTGWASAIVAWGMFLMAAAYVQLAHPEYSLFSRFTPPDLKALAELLGLGWPIALTLAFESGLFSLTTLLMGLLGRTQLAAHQLAIQSAAIAFMVPLGLSIAISVRVGQARGRGDLAGVRRSGLVGMALATAFMSVTALLFWLLPERVLALYIDLSDPANLEVARLATGFLALAAVFQLFDGLQVSALGALRGLKDTRVPMLIALFSYWLVGLGVGASLAFGLGLGGRGLWTGLVAGLATAAVLLAWRFLRHSRPSATTLEAARAETTVE